MITRAAHFLVKEIEDAQRLFAFQAVAIGFKIGFKTQALPQAGCCAPAGDCVHARRQHAALFRFQQFRIAAVRDHCKRNAVCRFQDAGSGNGCLFSGHQGAGPVAQDEKPFTFDAGAELDARFHPLAVEFADDIEPRFQLVPGITELFHQMAGKLLADALVIGVLQGLAGEIVLQFAVDDVVAGIVKHSRKIRAAVG